MYFWNTYPFVRLSIILIFGITCYNRYPSIWDYALFVLPSLVFFYLLLIGFSNRFGFYRLRHLNGIIALALGGYIGGLVTKIQFSQSSDKHYTNITRPIKGFSGKITSTANERTNYYKYDMELTAIYDGDSTLHSFGSIHLYVRKDSSDLPGLTYGDSILIHGKFYRIRAPNNPHQFDYQKYMSNHRIYSQAFVNPKDIKVLNRAPPNWFLHLAYQIRAQASSTLNTYVSAPEENAIAMALLLGVKDHLDNDLKKSYATAGAMHVLAVSGLHIGIVYLLVRFFLGRLKASRTGSICFGLISTIIIWLYATVTGLSPSVLRAATMFSIIALSQISTREGNIYNTLGISAFLLLLFDPHLIYSVGFQLSYAAVFGIVYLQPKIYRTLNFNTVLFDKIWIISSVSIAAQLATSPLSAYYFHQFPTYFLVSNLVVIPSAFVILLLGILLFAVDIFSPFLGEIFGFFLSQFLYIINKYIYLIEEMPYSLIEWIYIDRIGLMLIYASILTLVWGLHHRSFKILCLSVTLFVGLSGYFLKVHLDRAEKTHLIFYEIANKTAIDHIQGHHATLYINEYHADELPSLTFQINPNRLASHTRPINETLVTFDESTQFVSGDAFKQGILGGLHILLFDTTTFHLDFIKPIHANILIIENGAVKNLAWLSQHFRFDLLIIGNRNSVYYSRQMKREAKKMNLNVHALKEDGALILPL